MLLFLVAPPRWALVLTIPLLILFAPSMALGQEEFASFVPADTDWGLVSIGTGYTFMLVALLRHHVPKVDGWLVPVLAVPLVAVAVSFAQLGSAAGVKPLLTHAGLLYVGAYGGAAGIRKVGAWALSALQAALSNGSIPPPPALASPPEESVPKPPRMPLPPMPLLCLSLLMLGCGGASNPCVQAYDKAETKADLKAADEACGALVEGGVGGEGGAP